MKNINQHLALVFDDNLETVKWKNVVDYTILGLIVLSTVEIFLSTYDSIVARYSFWLNLVDYVTIAVFTVEVTLRIWCADLLDDKYKGFKGRIRYCLSFYGLVDLLSTYTFYLALIFPIPYMAFKVLRVLRLVRVFRYIKAFNILSRAVSSKKNELLVSLEFLVIVTLMLSFVLYFVEHEAQPDVYVNGWVSVLWAFMQYVGDPGSFADTPPITLLGHVIAVIIGLLGIAIFAVPAGLIGSAFSDVMNRDARDNELKDFECRIIRSFKFELDQQHTNLFHVPRYLPLNTITTSKFISEADIIETVSQSDCLHLYNLADAMNKAEKPEDKIVVVNFLRNTPYGTCIDRGSKVTIVNTSGPTEPLTSWMAYHIAKIGGFNYVAKEVESDPDNPVTYYNIADESACPNLCPFLDDIERLSAHEGSWVIPILGATGLKNRSTQWHFCYATTKHDCSYDDPNKIITDVDTFESMYQEMESEVSRRYEQHCDKNEWYAINKANVSHHLKCANQFTLRIETSLFVFDGKFLEFAKLTADVFNKHLEPGVEKPVPQEMLKRPIGLDFGFGDYVEKCL